MGIKVALKHRTQYRYDKAVSLGPQVVQLRPAPHCRTPILSYALNIVPAKHYLSWQLDPHQNYLARLLFPEKTTEFTVEVDLVAELSPFNPFNFLLEPGIEQYPFQYAADMAKDLEPYLVREPAGPRLRAFVDSISRESTGTIGFLVALNHKVRDQTGYVVRLDPGVQSCEQTLELRSGSCRDSAWLLVEILRHLGIAARFVSGYLIQLAPDEVVSDAPAADSADLHAWTEAFLPGAGWIGLDPTSGLLAGEGHIPLVCTPNASNAAPIGGTVEPAGVEFAFEMTIRRLDEPPRLSKPFTDAEWEEVRAVAHGLDADLAAHDARLTMGGEPTFVGVDDPESPQWNIEALGEMKRIRGLALIQGLRAKTAPGALLHYGQGKWYPGEPLPRWALSCYWRSDGVPVWESLDRIAREDQDYGAGAPQALQFLEALTRRLQVGAENILPAYNDDTSTGPAGYILPIRRRQPEGKMSWSSQLWFPRPERFVLLQGDSPMGFRLPVEAMPWVAPDELVYEYEPAPHDDWVKLPATRTCRLDLFHREPAPDPLPPLSSTAETATELIRPSLCVQAREGRLCVFLPYESKLADYLEVLSAVEDTCEYLKQPVWLEGYTPPSDPRMRFFSVTPDPGVLEVNLPPASDWDELERLNTILFEEAKHNRLTAEKFTYNGGHVATGGGSHIVAGGATVLDSPFLRRPSLLRSMVTFWQNHPSLSYLFSGMYIGPTSQYPRVDEARMDSLYELEVAFSQLPSDDCPPWVVDALLRHLLVDVTGNSHRAEFCIDKMFAPEGAGLRLGLLELRAFEMAPHLRMGLVQMLLIRGLICAFWKQPYEGSLVRWGTTLHDRFLMPHFVKQDFAGVLAFLRHSGHNFQDKWYASHFEFRFPKLGSIAGEGFALELRQALEPWHVLAEESTSGRTVRSVDSSLERLQVKLSGVAAESRYLVTCNGRRVPLTAAGPHDLLAGSAFARGACPLRCTTVPVHAPLVFEVIDLWSQKPVGKCAYHMTPPDGHLYTERPANATDAEARRAERFEILEVTPGPITMPPAETNPLFPMTLDMRLPAPGRPIGVAKSGLVP